jgi:hypothetical protein
VKRSSISNFGIYRAARLAKAQSVWRDAARLVGARWETFLQAEAPMRSFAFASYVAALDAEEAAATEMSRLVPATAGYGMAA